MDTIEKEIKRALNDDEYLEELIESISPKRKSHEDREKGAKVLIGLSQSHPERLYGKWNVFFENLKSNNAFSKYPSLYIIANIVTIDSENKFASYIDQYLDLINDESVMVASHLALNCGKIAKIKPEYENKITRKLLDIDSQNHSKDHKELIKSYIIEAFYGYVHQSTLKREITDFIKEQVNSESNKTKKLAKKILEEM